MSNKPEKPKDKKRKLLGKVRLPTPPPPKFHSLPKKPTIPKANAIKEYIEEE